MAADTTATSSMSSRRGSAESFIAMETCISATGRITCRMVEVATLIRMVRLMRETGSTISIMGKAEKSGLMEPYLKANIKKGRSMGGGASPGLTVANSKANSH